MKLLVVAPIPTDPLDAGNRARLASLIDGLAREGHEVHLAHVQTGHFDGEAMRRRIGADRVHLFPFVPNPPRLGWPRRLLRIAQRAMRIEAGYLWPLDSWYDSTVTPGLAALHARHRFDAVMVAYVFFSKAFEAFPAGCLRILDTHDRFGLRHREFLRVGMRPRWFSTTLAEEEEGFRRADVVLAIQSEEAAQFRRRLGGEVPTVLEVGHLIAPAMPTAASARAAALFLGSANPINVEGVEHFVRRILPVVRAARPDFEFLVAGAVAGLIVDAPGVVKLGFVADLADAFGKAMLFVNPVLMGTGVSIKMLDALAYGMPCVSTRAGARGLEAGGEAIAVVDDDDDATGFAARVIALLDDASARSTMRLKALEAAQRWNARQLATLQTLLACRSPDAEVRAAG